MGIFKRLFGGSGTDDKGGETPEFKALLDQSIELLHLLTDVHQIGWQFGKEKRWDFDQEKGQLVLTFSDKVVSTPAQIIGTFDSKKGTWMWAWANPSVVDSIQRDSLLVRKYGQENNIRRLTIPKWAGVENDGWDMTALACRLCGSKGAYRGSAGTTFVYMIFGEVQITKKT